MAMRLCPPHRGVANGVQPMKPRLVLPLRWREGGTLLPWHAAGERLGGNMASQTQTSGALLPCCPVALALEEASLQNKIPVKGSPNQIQRVSFVLSKENGHD